MKEKKRVGALIDLAIEVAVGAHHNQIRKGTDIPYITHPLTVGIILAKAGCSDEVIVASILHDTVEDTSITLMKIFELTKTFPPEEKYSMVDQMRRSSRSVCANFAEAWRKRYNAAFIATLSVAESEASETHVGVEFPRRY